MPLNSAVGPQASKFLYKFAILICWIKIIFLPWYVHLVLCACFNGSWDTAIKRAISHSKQTIKASKYQSTFLK